MNNDQSNQPQQLFFSGKDFVGYYKNQDQNHPLTQAKACQASVIDTLVSRIVIPGQSNWARKQALRLISRIARQSVDLEEVFMRHESKLTAGPKRKNQGNQGPIQGIQNQNQNQEQSQNQPYFSGAMAGQS